MAKTVIRVMFDDATAAEGFLERCRGEGLDAVVEDARPIGTVKRNGPGLASWLKAHPGWHVVAESVNRRAAWAAATLLRDTVGTELSDAQVHDLRAAIESVGALSAVEDHIELLTHRALELLDAAPVHDQAKIGLAELARLAANRSA